MGMRHPRPQLPNPRGDGGTKVVVLTTWPNVGFHYGVDFLGNDVQISTHIVP